VVTALVDANNNTTAYQYDLLGRVIKKTNPDLTERKAVYDDANNCVTIYDELDHFIKRYYDGLNRLQTVEWYKDGHLFLKFSNNK
jgi:YD repeat-containing protein